MGKYLTYIVPPIFYLLVSLAGRTFTSHGLLSWYPSIAKPSFTPPGHVIAIVWTMICTLSAISVMHFVNTAKSEISHCYHVGSFQTVSEWHAK